MADFDDIQSYKTDTNYEKDLPVSARLEKAKNSTDWGTFYANLNMNDVLKASKDPVNRIYNVQDLENITSDAGTIAYDTFRKGVLDLASIGDKAEMALGNTLAGVSGDTFGAEMRNRAYDNLMKTMEDSQFIDSNYGDAETWTARFVGGGMSMGEMLAIGAMSGPVGLGAFVGTLSLSDGALNDMAKYEEEHGNLDGYETDPVNLALDYGNAVFQIGSELVGGTGRLLNGRVLKAGKTGTAIVKESLTNFLQESLQGAASDLTEVLKGNQDLDILADNATGYIKDGIVAGTLGGAIGGAFYKVNKGRAIESIDKINQKLHPEMSEQDRQDLNEDIFAKTEEEGLKSFAPQTIAHAEAVNDKGAIRDNIQKKVEFMYRDAEDMSEKQKAQAVEATTTVELENILYDSIERKIPLTEHPLLKGEINELGWFRDGIPANRRADIEALNNELVELRRQHKELNEAQEKDYEKLEALETKIEQFQKDLPEKIKDLVVSDKAELRKMLAEQRARVQDKIVQREFVKRIQKRVQADKDRIAEQMASGAEKAQAKRETSETAQQTKEAKIRSLKEQREISSAIKRLKAKQKREQGDQTYKPIPTDEAYDMLVMAGYAGDQIKRMSYQDIVDALEKFAQTQPEYMNQTDNSKELESQRRISVRFAQDVIESLKNLNSDEWSKTADGDYILNSFPPVIITDSKKLPKNSVAAYAPETQSIYIGVKNIAKQTSGQISRELQNGKIQRAIQHEYQHFIDDAAKNINMDPNWLERNFKTFYFNSPAEFNAFSQELLAVNAIRYNLADKSGKQKIANESLDDLIRFVRNILQDKTDSSFGQALNKQNRAELERRLSEQQEAFREEPGRLFYQTKESGKGADYRGAYIPEYRFIAKTANLDASTLAHELAHDWGQENFRWARSGRASADFMKAWGAVEKAIGITDKDTYFTYEASEKFARAYEGWLMQRKDWADILKINNDDERKAVEEAMEDYRQQIVEIYESLSSPYFKQAWGKVGELKPELQEWFDRSNKFDSLDARVARGEITEEKAAEEKLADMVVVATDSSMDSLSTQDLQAADAIEQLDKYEQQLKETAKQFEVEGGNINRLQKRLDDIALAKDMIANNEALKRHDTHRDMIKAAESADAFVRTRLEDALAIINGKMAEQDGIYASELYTALERLATEQGDYNLINELRNSKIATDLAKELGQRVAGFRNYKGDGDLDIMSALKSLDKQYEKAYNDKAKEQVDTEIKALETELTQQDKAADSQLGEFFNELECK